MQYRYIFGSIVLIGACFLLYSFQIRSSFQIPFSSINNSIQHTAIILARRPSIKVLKHLNVLVNAGVNAFIMSDENPSNYTNLTKRIVYVDDKNLAQYGLTRNRAWDRVFLWLYNQSSIDYVWIMEDDVTWTHVRHIVNLFDKYANNKADLLSKSHIYRNNQTLGWIWWPKTRLDLFPENKWAGSLNMLSRVSRRLIQGHQYYIKQLYHQRQKNSSTVFDDNYYFQEFFTPTVAHMFNLTVIVYDDSNMDVGVIALSEDNIRSSLEKRKQIFHPVKHDSPLLANATQ